MTRVSDADLAVDRELASIAGSFEFLVDVSPVNTEQARDDSRPSSAAPRFRYRPLEDIPTVIEARLAKVDLSSVEDPTLRDLFAAKKNELELQLAMLEARNTDRFLELSVRLYGAVTQALEAAAEDILNLVAPRGPRGRHLGAESVARRARDAIAVHRRTVPDLTVAIEVRPDIAGVMVSNGNLLIPASTSVPIRRMRGLLAHEVETHILTYVNGSKQPLKLMAVGLAGYEETQEGLALMAEAMVGALTVSRLRLIAARVVAVRRMLDGWSLPDTHRLLTARKGFDPTVAFTIAARVYRAGGLTKDAVYLRGLQELVEYVAGGHDLARLWVGKLSLNDLPLVDGLRARSVLIGALLLPAFLADPDAKARLDTLAHSEGLHTLIGVDT